MGSNNIMVLKTHLFIKNISLSLEGSVFNSQSSIQSGGICSHQCELVSRNYLIKLVKF